MSFDPLKRLALESFYAPLALVAALLAAAVVVGLLPAWAGLFGFVAFVLGLYWHRGLAGDGSGSGRAPFPEVSEVGHRGDADPQPAAAEPSWRGIIDSLPDPAVIVDHEAFIVHYNPLLADLFPRARLGQPITRLTRNPELLAVLETRGRESERQIVTLQDRVPVQRSLSAIVTSIVDDGDEHPPRSLIVFRDLTDQQKHAQLRADFISHASHELRTPLASLKSMVETLQGAARNDTAARERFLAMMQSQAARMTRLIDDLLSLSRAEMRAHVTPTGRVELNDLIEWVVETLEPMAQGLESKVVVQPLDGPAWVRGDRDDLVQVFQNLLQNALKYGGDQGRVEITIGRQPSLDRHLERISVSIRDHGPGIPAEHIPRLTERFYRVSAVESREKGGTGLGLAIVNHIVKRHRGELQISSTPGEGSEFTVYLDPPDRIALNVQTINKIS